MNPVYEKLLKCYESMKEEIPFRPKTAADFRSILWDCGEEIRIEKQFPIMISVGFSSLPFRGIKEVASFWLCGNVPVATAQGRVHYYEGYSMTDVVLPVRLM